MGSGGWDEEEPFKLSATLDQLPAKSFGEIFEETKPPGPGGKEPDYDNEINKIASRIGKESPEKLSQEVEELLKQARLNYEDSSECNLLQDVLDVVKASSKDVRAAQDYLHWRVEHRNWFGFQPKVQNDDTGDNAPKKPDPTDNEKAELKRLAEKASGPIKAHWLYLVGALTFSNGDREECREWFERVAKEFPDHPRAEAALFLLARCDLVKSRDENLTPADRTAAQKKAAESFMQFRRKYPNGRFDSDALGWLGAIAFDTDDYETALKYYIAQAEDPAHPEQRKSAVFMCEKSMAHLNSGEDNSAAFALIAQHPKVAMGYIYQVLNAPESDNFDGNYDPPEKVRKWRRKVLPLIAAQVAKQHDLYKANDWQPRYLAMLAYAASESGDQAQALQITQVAAEQLNRSDDLLFARGLAQQRGGHAPEAIETYRTLLKTFPKSQLAVGVRLRLALALQDNHQAGAAIVALRALGTDLDAAPVENKFDYGLLAPADADLAATESAVYPDIRGTSDEQIHMIIDSLLNFAPLPELAAVVDDPAFDDATKSEMRAVIAERYLTAEDFADAKKYMTEAQFNLQAAKLEKLTRAADIAPAGKERAEKFAEVGDAWAAVRGELLLLPLDGGRGAALVAGAAYTPPDFVTRRENGQALGLANVDTELEDRDELRHASRWWMRAARENPGTPLAASARWKALEAMPVIAAASDFAETRAQEIHMDKVSREIYDKLRSENPDSVEARRYAAYWSIPAPQKDTQGNEVAAESNEEEVNTDINQIGYEFPDDGAFNVSSQISNSSGGEDGVWQEIAVRIGKLQDNARKWNVARMGKEIDELAGMARDKRSSVEVLTTLNFLDDMALFTREKDVTPQMLQAYLDIRLGVLGRTNWGGSPMAVDNEQYDDSGNGTGISPRDKAVETLIEKALKDPAMKPIADYLECARIGMVAAEQIQVETSETDFKADSEEGDNNAGPGHYTYASRDFARMEKLCREFLKKYPASRKRDAVAFVLARSVVSLSKPHIAYVGKPAPGTGPKDSDIDEVKKILRAEPFSAKRVNEVLDAYDHEFPKGRYSADIRDYRAYVAWQTHDWGKALDLTLAQLDDNSDPVLQGEAALRLANIFAGLKNTANRPDLMDAIRQRPAAKNRLLQYVATIPKETSHPLRYMQAYLTDQFPADAK